MPPKIRWVGLDLLRGVAIYAVIVLHSDETIANNPWGWSSVLEFSKFAVPFFLATAFYLNFQKIYSQSTSFPLGSRLLRLLIPYGIWSGIYLLYKVAKYGVEGDFSRISQIFQDPFALIFTGGAAFHLYFLPLLMAGTILVGGLAPWTRRIPIGLLGAFVLLSLGGYQWLLASGNEFNNGQGMAFSELLTGSLQENALIRAIAVFAAWVIRCCPYVAIAMVLNHPVVAKRFPPFNQAYLIVALLAFFCINAWGLQTLPAALYEIGRGYITLAVAILISQSLKYQNWIQSLGNCSFGIYLGHLILVEATYIILARLTPDWIATISTVSLLTIAFLVLLSSWGITYLLRRVPQVSKILFGA